MNGPTYRSKWPVYAKQWDAMRINPDRAREMAQTARKIVAGKARYQTVEKVTGVPWYFIGAVHIRESNGRWDRSLAQGDPWNRVSTHVPAGRGPFASWEAAAIDALQLQGLTRVIDWRLEKILYNWEAYNGWGYYAHGIPSPYVFGGTNIQKPGKYVRDGVWSSFTMDSQPGTAALLKAIMALDPSVKPVRET